MRMANRTARPAVPAVDRAARTLRLLAARPEGRALSDLARDLAVSKASLREILLTLGQYGLVERDDALRFSLGPELARLARAARRDLVTTAGPVVRQLVREFDETVILGVPEPPRLRLAVVAEPDSPLHVAARENGRIPLAAGCHGQVLVAGAALGIDDETYVDGVRAVAAPILIAERPAACLFVVGFKKRLTIARLRKIGVRLQHEAARIAMATDATFDRIAGE